MENENVNVNESVKLEKMEKMDRGRVGSGEGEGGRRMPTNATGGCLCGAIRYRIRFPRGHDFKKSSAKCFCTACRKQSGSIFLPLHAIPISHFTCTAAVSALGDYSCSPGVHRLFCKLCGSFVAWQQDPRKRRGVHVGEGEGRVEVRQSMEGGVGSGNVKVDDEADSEGGVEKGVLVGCAGEMESVGVGEEKEEEKKVVVKGIKPEPTAEGGLDAEAVQEDDTLHGQLASTKLEPLSPPPSSSTTDTHNPGPCNWDQEGEIEICVGTLDETFLVGRRDKAKNVIPGTGFGDLVAHPEGSVLWAENEIAGVTDSVTGPRWKYNVRIGVRMPGYED